MFVQVASFHIISIFIFIFNEYNILRNSTLVEVFSNLNFKIENKNTTGDNKDEIKNAIILLRLGSAEYFTKTSCYFKYV